MAEAELATMEKRGVATGFTATHPITGKEIPVWVSQFCVNAIRLRRSHVCTSTRST